MPSKITLTFVSIPNADEYITLRVDLTTPEDLKETFKPVRSTNYEVTRDGVGTVTLMNLYSNAFSADYNGVGLFEITGNTVDTPFIEITHPDSGFFTPANVFNTTGGAITTAIVDTPDPILINITDVAFTQSASPCDDVTVGVTTDVLAVFYTLDGGSQIANAVNPFSFDQIRGVDVLLQVENAEGNTSSQTVLIPDKLVSSNVSEDIVNSPNGATVTINVSSVQGLVLEYSLDNVTFQPENTFTGILEGDYTIYVRDDLGCTVSKAFTVEAYGDGTAPYADLPSKSNSIRFAKDVTWGDCSDYKNDENTLSCQQPYTQNPRQVNQLLQTCDIITTQIKSNYETIEAFVVAADGNQGAIPVVKKTENIGLKDKRDALQYQLPNNQSGVYFLSGNTYDFDPPSDINGSYTLNGSLPDWGYIGNFLQIGLAWFEIVDIRYDESKNAEVLVINSNFVDPEISIIVGSIYSLQPFDVYEFEIDMGNYPDQTIQVKIVETDTNVSFPDVTFISEYIEVAERHYNTVYIRYYSDINTDIYYASGIVNVLRIPIEYVEGTFEDETEPEKTDINVYLVNAEIYESDTFHFQLLSKQLIRKVMQALAHKFVSIDGVDYIKNNSPTLTNLVGTNLYRMSAPMIKAENVYTSQDNTGEFNAGEFEAVNLIEPVSGGYVKWRN